jgi:hypothetical protein
MENIQSEDTANVNNEENGSLIYKNVNKVLLALTLWAIVPLIMYYVNYAFIPLSIYIGCCILLVISWSIIMLFKRDLFLASIYGAVFVILSIIIWQDTTEELEKSKKTKQLMNRIQREEKDIQEKIDFQDQSKKESKK